MPFMKPVDPRAALRNFVAGHASQRAAAKALGIGQAYMSDLLSGRRDIGPKILAKLGLKQIVVKAS